ncbi:hypothetical protein JXM83_03210 [Candidatus Woesearchaeota archaeon]|nr:hypothetical protein [Candidatus Woesearchaeota archaeon]
MESEKPQELLNLENAVNSVIKSAPEDMRIIVATSMVNIVSKTFEDISNFLEDERIIKKYGCLDLTTRNYEKIWKFISRYATKTFTKDYNNNVTLRTVFTKQESKMHRQNCLDSMLLLYKTQGFKQKGLYL